MNFFTDDEIIEAITSDKNPSPYLSFLYTRNFKSIRYMVATHGGRDEDAEDIFQEAITICVKNIREGKFRKDAKISTYLYRIAYNRWMKAVGRKHTPTVREQEIVELGEDLNILDSQVRKDMLKILEQLGEECRELLIEFYFYKKSYEEIIELEPFCDKYSSLSSLTNRKLKCWKTLNHLIEEYKKKNE